MTGWWQLKYFLFPSLPGEKIPILTSIFFKGVGSTTNQVNLFTNSWASCFEGGSSSNSKEEKVVLARPL